MQKFLNVIFIFCFFILITACAPFYKNYCEVNPSNQHGFFFKNTEQNCDDHDNYRVFGKSYHPLHSSKNYEAYGKASWYGPRFNHRRTFSGERFNMHKLTAAHKTLPMRTKVLVTNLLNGKEVIVRVNDRGPFVDDRLIDLSYFAAKKIGMVGHGVVPVKVKALA